jgi:type III secretory pathway lipoprotein EscJ
MGRINARTAVFPALLATASGLLAACAPGSKEPAREPGECVQPGVEQLLGSSLLPDPDERRLRREHALAGELAATLRELPGVHAARVHLSLPVTRGFGREPATPGSAMIVLRADLAVVPGKPQIARLAAGAVPGLPAGNIEIQVNAEPVACPELASIGPVRVTRETANLARVGVAALLVVCLGLAAGMLFVGLRLRRLRSGPPSS